MKKAKAIGIVAVFCLVVLAFVGTAAAQVDSYEVKKGDTLWGISWKKYGTGNFWQKIAKNNRIINPKKIRVGQKLTLPNVGKIRIVNHLTAPYGAGTVKSDTKVLAAIDKIDARFADIKPALKESVIGNDPRPLILKRGDEADCVSDKKGVYCNIDGYIYSWKKVQELPAVIWSAENNRLVCEVRVIRHCGNFDLRCREKEVLTEEKQPKIEIAEETQPAELPSAKEIEIKPTLKLPVEEKPIIILSPTEKPEIKLPEEKTDFYRVKYPPQCRHCVEHEPIAGIYGYMNNAAHGYGVYGEYMAWLRKKCNGGYLNGWSFGAGAYGYYSQGWSDFTTFEWWEKGIGPEIGAKYLNFHSDGEPYQFQMKARLIQEWTKGWNSEGYWDRQKHLKPGLYVEFSKRADGNTLWGFTGEAWWSVRDSIKSSWLGAEPSNRTTFMAAGYVQKKTGENTQIRVSAMPAWTGWDEQSWLNLAAELRIKETFMIGPSVGIPIGVSGINQNFGLGWQDMLTGRIFARLELGKPLRDLDARAKSRRVMLVGGPAYASAINNQEAALDKNSGPVKIDSQVISQPGFSPVEKQDF